MTKTLANLAETMRDIDFTLLTTLAADGGLAARPMSNNRDVDFDGDSFFFALGDTQVVGDIARNPKVGMTLHGNSSLLGKPPIFITVAGTAELIRDKAAFERHWNKDLERWFEQGTDTPGLTLIKVHAGHVHYWDGEEQGEITAS
ncbi:pyridoxamine 5'-phosphate oxidase family protein [Sphingomonas sp. AR_OL41]|jgi:general stress protein 26|uniref:pyridoxamine 5'-phosphate oxidase family protein n=1 Tax=Sphingomonas sp. AR_OL41 TaxID=3042729 RepID=UPI0024814FCE|nr:pyridoxamine 5'-phosphate oxidase family protein [Sphingomonas sp. AR_OL41]MDH7973112.1 pyridoxamine 5'-phosphate oxidase family protein [Sphingomonas sp. AR_OL41]